MPKVERSPKWAKAKPVADAPGWWESRWFGSFHRAVNGWIYQDKLGWLYAVGADGGGVWLWQENLGWLWTREGIFPFVYGHEKESWHYFFGSADGRVFLYRYADKRWLDAPQGGGK